MYSYLECIKEKHAASIAAMTNLTALSNEESFSFPSRRKLSVVKSPRCPGTGQNGHLSCAQPTTLLHSSDKLWPEKKKKKKTNMLPIFLASQPWICFSDDKEPISKKKKKKGKQKNTSKNPATRIQMDFHGFIFTEPSAQRWKLGLHHVCY